MTMDDDRLQQLLRAAFPPPQEQDAADDLWRRVEGRFDEPARWSWVDAGLAALVALALFALPGSFLLIAYHL